MFVLFEELRDVWVVEVVPVPSQHGSVSVIGDEPGDEGFEDWFRIFRVLFLDKRLVGVSCRVVDTELPDDGG